eukprot:Clim_evm68s243 gene=Clim_evmTU68s243
MDLTPKGTVHVTDSRRMLRIPLRTLTKSGSLLTKATDPSVGYSLQQRFNHSSQKFVGHTNMDVHIVPVLEDNYAYLLVDKETNTCAAVDPVQAEVVTKAAKAKGLTISKIMTTHHHWDHSGGNNDMKKLNPNVSVLGGDDRVEGMTEMVKQGDQFTLGSLNVKCLHTPCHTTGHISYYVTHPNGESDPAVFTGDTLFVGGCGRFFEGEPNQMVQSLTTLGSLPPSTRVYCGHEYTVKNLQFAQVVEPNNIDLKDKLSWCQQQRAEGKPTIPSTIGEELKYNPFMRFNQKDVKAFAKSDEDTEVMGKVRAAKDSWKGP